METNKDQEASAETSEYSEWRKDFKAPRDRVYKREPVALHFPLDTQELEMYPVKKLKCENDFKLRILLANWSVLSAVRTCGRVLRTGVS